MEHVIAAELSATGAQDLLAATSGAHLAYTADMPKFLKDLAERNRT